jgi:hypothetical protein
MSEHGEPGELPVQMDLLLAYLADAHGAQLAAANLSAAKWRAAASGAAAELTVLREQLRARDDPARDATPAPVDLDG